MTLPGMIRERHTRWKDRRCMQVKRDGAYQDVTWETFYGRAMATARGLLAMGVAPGQRVAVSSHTRWEWAVVDTAILSVGAVSVPLYPTLNRKEAELLLERSGARVLFASDAEQAEKFLPVLGRLASLERLVLFERAAAEATDDPKMSSLEAFEVAEDPELDGEIERRMEAADGNTLATVIFTSGTTGEPKGVMLSHANILADIEASLQGFTIDQRDVCLAHLPLAHILERMAGHFLMLSCGATIAYAENLQSVAQNIQEVRPTIAVSVPRIFEKIFAGIQTKAVEAPAPIRGLTFWALRVGRDVGEWQAQNRQPPLLLKLQFALADRLVFAKIRAKMGGRLRFFISGGAPLPPELGKFFNAVGIRIYEGYGLTETSPVLAVNTPAANRVGTVGQPLHNVELKIAEDGEILARGPNVFLGYFEDEAGTREAFTEDGFFSTGDIGEIDADGFLRITDRKKDLIVTAGGKNVAPQKVENVLKRSKYISDVMLYGDRKKFLSALIVPDFDWLRRYAQWKKLDAQSPEELVRHPQVLDYYRRLVEETQRKADLASYESVKRFVLLDHEFGDEPGQVTPTMKIRRGKVVRRYQEQLDALYEEE